MHACAVWAHKSTNMGHTASKSQIPPVAGRELQWTDNCSLRTHRAEFTRALDSFLPKDMPLVLTSVIVDYCLKSTKLVWFNGGTRFETLPPHNSYPIRSQQYTLDGWLTSDLPPRHNVPQDCNGWRFFQLRLNHPTILDIVVRKDCLWIAIRLDTEIHLHSLCLFKLVEKTMVPFDSESSYIDISHPQWVLKDDIPRILNYEKLSLQRSLLWKDRWCFVTPSRIIFWDFCQLKLRSLPHVIHGGRMANYVVSGDYMFLIQSNPLGRIEIYVLIEVPFPSSEKELYSKWHLLMRIEGRECIVHPFLPFSIIPPLNETEWSQSPQELYHSPWSWPKELNHPDFLPCWKNFCLTKFGVSLKGDPRRVLVVDEDWVAMISLSLNPLHNALSLCRRAMLDQPNSDLKYPFFNDPPHLFHSWQLLHFLNPFLRPFTLSRNNVVN